MEFNWTFGDDKSIHLKAFLHQHGVSHRLFLKLRNQKLIKINHHLTGKNVKLSAGDQVEITLPDEPNDPQVAISDLPISIQYEDTNWLVVDKPAGLTSVPGPSNASDTLVNRVKGYLITQQSANLRPHLITRLDRFTSGLILIAKHQLANSVAVQMNQKHLINKQYLAVVSGIINHDQGVIDQPIGRVAGQIQRQVLSDGQRAITEYEVIKRLDHRTVVKVKLKTGRTHQIRVHFASIGHPLVGDQLYGGPVMADIKHQALDAHWLSFVDPFTNQQLRFTTTIPVALTTLITDRS